MSSRKERREMITARMLGIVFGNVVLDGMSFHVGEGKAGEIDLSDVKVNLEGCTLASVLAWVTSGQSLRVKLQGIMRDLDPRSAQILKKTWETEGVNLKYIVRGKRGKGKSVQDPAILLAQMTPEARKALFAKYQD